VQRIHRALENEDDTGLCALQLHVRSGFFPMFFPPECFFRRDGIFSTQKAHKAAYRLFHGLCMNLEHVRLLGRALQTKGHMPFLLRPRYGFI